MLHSDCPGSEREKDQEPSPFLDGVFLVARTTSTPRDLHEEFEKGPNLYCELWRWPLTELWDPIRYALNARPFLTCH